MESMSMILVVFYLGVIVAMVAAQWKIYEKAGKPGWACLVPFYNIIVLLEIVGKPTWWILLLFIPLANIYAAVVLSLQLYRISCVTFQ